MWQFAPDRRMMTQHSPCPGAQGLWRKLATYRPAIATLKDKAIVPDETSATSLRAPPNTMSHG
jgi:hypothetical protein